MCSRTRLQQLYVESSRRDAAVREDGTKQTQDADVVEVGCQQVVPCVMVCCTCDRLVNSQGVMETEDTDRNRFVLDITKTAFLREGFTISREGGSRMDCGGDLSITKEKGGKVKQSSSRPSSGKVLKVLVCDIDTARRSFRGQPSIAAATTIRLKLSFFFQKA